LGFASNGHYKRISLARYAFDKIAILSAITERFFEARHLRPKRDVLDRHAWPGPREQFLSVHDFASAFNQKEQKVH
jgi:hypothetical protein